MGTTFEEQQEAREEYQAKVRASKGKSVNLNATHSTPNPVVEYETVGEALESRKDETTAEEIQASGEAMGTYGEPVEERVAAAIKEEEEEEDAADEEEPVDADVDASADGDSEEVAEESAAPEAPNKSASKAEWVAYVAALTGESEEDIDSKHIKDELVEKYG